MGGGRFAVGVWVGVGGSTVRARKPRSTVTGTTATFKAATTSRWAVTEMSSATQAAPPRAPSTVPTLKPAWKRGMIVRSRRCSTSAPSTFMATSQVPLP